MIGKCCTCDAQILKTFQRRFCKDCIKERNTIKFRKANQKRDGRKKIPYHCIICDTPFFSVGKRKQQICNENKCQNYLKNLSKKIQTLQMRIEKTDDRKNLLINKLAASETEYKNFNTRWLAQ